MSCRFRCADAVHKRYISKLLQLVRINGHTIHSRTCRRHCHRGGGGVAVAAGVVVRHARVDVTRGNRPVFVTSQSPQNGSRKLPPGDWSSCACVDQRSAGVRCQSIRLEQGVAENGTLLRRSGVGHHGPEKEGLGGKMGVVVLM